jgi:hypothetical protein
MNSNQYNTYQKYVHKLIVHFTKNNTHTEIAHELKKLNFNDFKRTISFYKTDKLNKDIVRCYVPLSELKEINYANY